MHILGNDHVGNNEASPLERRSCTRLPAGFVGSIRLFGHPPEKCVIEDLSARGAKIRRFFAGYLPRFLNIEIVPGMTVPAAVIWEDDSCIGVKFTHSVGPNRPVRRNS